MEGIISAWIVCHVDRNEHVIHETSEEYDITFDSDDEVEERMSETNTILE